MIRDLDELLRQLLIKELPIKSGEVDISFDQPKREWSTRLGRPTINLFLHDVRENTKLRNIQWENQAHNNPRFISQQRTPVRVDIHYLITAWAVEAMDEHRLLTRILLALFRFSRIPENMLPKSLKDQPLPIPLKVAQYDELQNPADIWSALDNEIKPSVICRVTLALNPFKIIETPLVSTRELRIGQSHSQDSQELNEGSNGQSKPEPLWTIGGLIHSQEPLEQLRLTLLEHGLEVPIRDKGYFAIGRLRQGDYTLEISGEGRTPTQHKITVPSPDYEIEV